MKNIIILSLAISFLYAVNCPPVKAQDTVMVQYTHNLEGKILATDFESSRPTIKVEYVKSDEYSGGETKEIVLIIDEDTKIMDESGKEIKKEELKSENEVSVIYRIKWNFKRKPLWKIAQSITLKAKPGQPAHKE